jgi:replicative DNA helicase
VANIRSRKSDPLLDRTPPHDLDAEASLLSAIFITNDVLFDITDILTPEDFYKGAHKKIFRVILDLAAQEEPADLVTVANALKKKG